MLSILNIRHKIFKHNKIAILSFHVKDQSLIDFNLSLIENNKNTIAILKTLNIKDYTVKTIKKHLPKSIPVYIHINGEGVLIRKTKEIAENESLSDILPGFDANNYYYQVNPISNGLVILSLVRRDSIAKWLTEMNDYQIQYSGLFIGASPFISLISLIEKPTSKLTIGNYGITTQDKTITEVVKHDIVHDTPISLLGENYSFPEAIALSCGILAFKNKTAYNFNDPIFISGLKEANSFIIQSVLTKWILSFLFILLLINYFIFDKLYAESNKLQNKVIANESMLTTLSKKQEEFELKKKFITENKLDDFYYLSYFSDKIGSITNTGIQLEKLDFTPLKKAIKKGEQILFQNNVVSIQGIAKNITYYQKFLSGLENEPWQTSYISQQYIYTPGRNSASFNLEIECDLSLINKTAND